MKKLSSVFYILIFLVLPFISKGQDGYEDAVYQRNGNIVYGTIIEKVPGKYITIKSTDDNTYTINEDQIIKMTRVPVNGPKKSDTAIYPPGTKLKGFSNVTEINPGVGIGAALGKVAYGIRNISDYNFEPEIALGVGIGYYTVQPLRFISLFPDLRFYTNINSSVNTYVAINMGYSFILNEGYTSDFFVLATIGEKVKLSRKTALNVGLAYSHQSYAIEPGTYTYVQGGLTFSNLLEDETISYLSLNIGISFD